jgi:Amt family ammonium transporter
VHGVGGIVGSLLTGVFSAKELGGLGLNEGVSVAQQVGVQAVAIIATIAWSALFTFVILKAVEKMVGLRVSPDEEQEGLDIVLHEETGYHKL